MLGALLVGCGASTHRAALRISGEHGIGPALSRADLRSAHADFDPNTDQPIVVLELTPNGQRMFARLTHAIVQAAKQHHRPFHILLSVNGKVISAPYIDYHLFPNGLSAKSGIVMDVPSKRVARDLAAKLNR